MRPILQVLAKILGKEDVIMVHKSVLGVFSLVMNPEVILDIPDYLEDVFKTQFMNLSLTGCFRFPSIVTYLFLYIHVETCTQLGFNVMDINRNK